MPTLEIQKLLDEVIQVIALMKCNRDTHKNYITALDNAIRDYYARI